MKANTTFSDSVWEEIIKGNTTYEFEFLAGKILLSRLQLKYRIDPGSLSQSIDEAKALFEKFDKLPSAKTDLQKISMVANSSVKVMFNRDEVVQKISQGKKLLLAGDEQVIQALPTGQWIAGTIPYFMSENGGIFSQNQIYVTELPAYVSNVTICKYNEVTIANVYKDAPENGFSVIIIPALSPTHFSFALNAPKYDKFAASNLIGWIAGTDLKTLGKAIPKVYSGRHNGPVEKEAVVMHIELPKEKITDINIINIFKQGNGDLITFSEDGFSTEEVFINGNKQNFADYIAENNLDTRLPLVANYCGAMVNTSFQEIDKLRKRVDFYAPVFKDVQYKIADPVIDYVANFNHQMPREDVDKIFFSCNCILNYLYSELEGKKTGPVTGPVTFGEIAYQLVNQTMAYITIVDKV
jgi:hypothetical protein